MSKTPASYETNLGILDQKTLNLYEALCLKKVWDFLVKNRERGLDSGFVNKAHQHGFGFLYAWAGIYRRTTPLVGHLAPPAPHLISELMKNLFDDLEYRIKFLKKNHIEEIIQLTAWFEHRFICIHPYQNTNGRMGRLLSNHLLAKLHYPPLIYSNRSKNRRAYIAAMRKADQGNFSFLENFIAKELSEAISSIDRE